MGFQKPFEAPAASGGGGASSPEIYRGATAPAAPHSYSVWIDTSASPARIREWDGAAWNLHGHQNASTSAAGFLSAADKTKLDDLLKVGPGLSGTGRTASPLTSYSTGYFYAYANATQSFTYGQESKVIFGTEDTDRGGWFVPGSGASQSRYTPQLSGTYIFWPTILITGMANNDLVSFTVYKNGSKIVELYRITISGGSIALSGAYPVLMNGTTDYVEIFCRVNGSGGSPQAFGASVTSVQGQYMGA